MSIYQFNGRPYRPNPLFFETLWTVFVSESELDVLDDIVSNRKYHRNAGPWWEDHTNPRHLLNTTP